MFIFRSLSLPPHLAYSICACCSPLFQVFLHPKDLTFLEIQVTCMFVCISIIYPNILSSSSYRFLLFSSFVEMDNLKSQIPKFCLVWHKFQDNIYTASSNRPQQILSSPSECFIPTLPALSSSLLCTAHSNKTINQTTSHSHCHITGLT